MSLIAATMPEDLAGQTAWLEKALASRSLGRLVAELHAFHGPGPAVAPTLDALLGANLPRFLARGLAGLSAAQLRGLLTCPRLLLELHERILMEGGPYWEGLLLRDDDLPKAVARGRQRLAASLAPPHFVPARRPNWTLLIALACLATAVAVFLVFRSWGSPASEPPSEQPAPPGEGKKYAFLVACSGYSAGEFRKLPGTVAEMKAFREVLLRTGFAAEDIVFLHDGAEARYLPEQRKIVKEFGLLLKRLGTSDELVVALDGHGLKFKGEQATYFVPTDGELKAPGTLVPMDGDRGLLAMLGDCKAGRKAILVNACRADPLDKADFAARSALLDDKGEAEVPAGVAALYSCGPGELSYQYPEAGKEGVAGRSLFYHHVIQAWDGAYSKGKPVTLEEVFREVRARASKEAADRFGKPQVPQVRGGGGWVVNPKREFLDQQIVNGIGLKLVRIPSGEFMMGSDRKIDAGSFASEWPRHAVKITRPFHLGVHEVTQGQFLKVMGYTSFFSTDGTGRKGVEYHHTSLPAGGKGSVAGWPSTDDLPVENVTWDEAVEFCAKLAALPEEKAAGRSYRLPTEAEWEYACRGGATSYEPYHFGRQLNGRQANCDGKRPWGTKTKGPSLGRTTTVGAYPANAWGLHDMHGNVWEWCADWYTPAGYASGAKTDPRGPESGAEHTIRGGGWTQDARGCRSAARFGAPNLPYKDRGFRVVLVPVS
ncbi:MAG: SUMF1/EgtB/PvdO family nonheme iron enzyme [Gemmataceae bacterium]|nr:SUMF1/EgtB/PvdO family nonheme iron enzyme [Gemmataceae bacterium]